MSYLYELIPPFLAKFLVCGLVFFIFINAINTKNYSRKSFWIFIFGLCFSLFFVGGYIYDLIKKPNLDFNLEYFSFLLLALGYTIITSLVYLIIGKRMNQHFSKYKISHKRIEKFLMILYKYQDGYLLKKQGPKQGLDIIPFPLGKYFHDEEITKHIKKKGLNVIGQDMVGLVIKDEKKVKKEYYCYLVKIENINSYLQNFDLIKEADLGNMTTDNKTREIALRMGLKTYFELKI